LIGAAFAFFSGPLGRIALYVIGAVALVGAAVFVVKQHDARVLAEQAAREAQAVAAQQIADMRRAVEAANAETVAANERAAKAATIKTEIARAPVTTACTTSPALRVVLDQLRASSAGPGAPGGPGGPAGVPGAAPAAKPAPR